MAALLLSIPRPIGCGRCRNNGLRADAGPAAGAILGNQRGGPRRGPGRNSCVLGFGRRRECTFQRLLMRPALRGGRSFCRETWRGDGQAGEGAGAVAA